MALIPWVATSCQHGDLVHKKSKRAFLDFCAEFKPRHRIHLGDNWDFRNLRRGADPKEEGDDMEEDWNAGIAFLDEFRPTVFCLGNHDHRAWKAREDARGLHRHHAKLLIEQFEERAQKLKITILPYSVDKGFYQLGDTVFFHGFRSGLSATRQNALTYGKCVFGHLHRVEHATAPRHNTARALCVGYLADGEKMHYADHQESKMMWMRGWGFGFLNDKTGVVTAWDAREEAGGVWMIP